MVPALHPIWSKCRPILWAYYMDGGSEGYTLSYVSAWIGLYHLDSGVPDSRSSRWKTCFEPPRWYIREREPTNACYFWYDSYGPAKGDFDLGYPQLPGYDDHGAKESELDVSEPVDNVQRLRARRMENLRATEFDRFP